MHINELELCIIDLALRRELPVWSNIQYMVHGNGVLCPNGMTSSYTYTYVVRREAEWFYYR